MEMKVSLSEDKREMVFEAEGEECRLGLDDAFKFLVTIHAIVGEMKAALPKALVRKRFDFMIARAGSK